MSSHIILLGLLLRLLLLWFVVLRHLLPRVSVNYFRGDVIATDILLTLALLIVVIIWIRVLVKTVFWFLLRVSFSLVIDEILIFVIVLSFILLFNVSRSWCIWILSWIPTTNKCPTLGDVRSRSDGDHPWVFRPVRGLVLVSFPFLAIQVETATRYAASGPFIRRLPSTTVRRLRFHWPDKVLLRTWSRLSVSSDFLVGLNYWVDDVRWATCIAFLSAKFVSYCRSVWAS